MSKPIALCKIKNFLGQKFIVWQMFVELIKSNTLLYKYYKDKRQDKEKAITISTWLIMIATQTATAISKVWSKC